MKKLLLLLLAFISLNAQSDLGIQERLGEFVPLDLTFYDENNKTVTLEKMMEGKPTIITLNYFRCAGICTPQLDELAKTLDKLDLAENTDYKVLTMSFAENETPSLAAAKRKTHLQSMNRPYVQDAWHFLISDGNSTARLAEAVGFKYEKVVNHVGKVDYLHPAALIIISPKGKITRYLNGVDQLPFDVKMALIESSQGKVGPTIAKGLLFCFEYDAQGKKYIFMWEKVAATIMLTIVFGFFIYLIKLGRKEDDRHPDAPEPREKKEDEK